MNKYKVLVPSKRGWRGIKEFPDTELHDTAVCILEGISRRYPTFKVTLNGKPQFYVHDGETHVVRCRRICDCRGVEFCAAAAWCRTHHFAYNEYKSYELSELKELCRQGGVER